MRAEIQVWLASHGEDYRCSIREISVAEPYFGIRLTVEMHCLNVLVAWRFSFCFDDELFPVVQFYLCPVE